MKNSTFERIAELQAKSRDKKKNFTKEEWKNSFSFFPFDGLYKKKKIQ